MARKVVVLIAALALTGCQRDFSLPNAKALSLSPQTTSVAPLERVTFVAKNGAKPYAFEIATDGSGGATVDPKTGDYQAGPSGPAEDVVRVTDAIGLSATARVTVGPKLVVTPTIALVAPGARVALVPTGGEPPYKVTAVEDGSNGTFETGGQTWDVGTTGDVVDLLQVEDAVGAKVQVQVDVGHALLLVATRDPTVAPRETLAFVATGGQAPYAFSIAFAGSAPGSGAPGDAPTVAPNGMYQAGSAGGKTDTVEVKDANGEIATVDVTVTAALTARLENPELHPDETVHVVASGGKPPYTFRFATRENRTGGTIDGITGLYTPGWAYGLADGIEVVDSVGVVAKVTPSPVGSLELPIGWSSGAVFADLDGNGLADLLVPDFQRWQLSTYLMQPGSLPVEHDYPTAMTGMINGYATAPGLDLDGDGRQDVLETNANGALGVWFPLPNGTLPQWTPLPVSNVDNPVQVVVRGSQGASIFTGTTTCNGLVRIDWPAGATAPSAPTCLPVLLTSNSTNWRMAFVDGDNEPDLVEVSGTSMFVAYGPTFTRTDSFTLPGNAVRGARPAAVRVGGTTGSPQQQAVFTLVGMPDGTSEVAGLADGVPFPAMVVPAIGDPSRARMVEVPDPAGNAGSVVVWDSLSRDLVAIGRDENGSFWARTSKNALPARSFDYATAGDANGDGVADLAFLGLNSLRTSIVWGDGHGSFGARARVGDVRWTYLADVDGDGLGDVMVQDGSTLSILYGANGGLAYGPSAAVLPNALVGVADLDGDGVNELLFVENGDGVWTTAPGPGGLWSNPVRIDLPAAANAATTVDAATASFGGSAPGPDLLLLNDDGTTDHTVAVVRDQSGMTALPLADLPNEYCFFPFPYDANGDGIDDVALSCWGFGTGNMSGDVFVDIANTTGGEVTSFAPATQLESLPWPGGLFYPAGYAGGAVGLYARGRNGAGATLVLLQGTTVTQRSLGYPITGGAIGDLDGDGTPDFVATGTDKSVHVILDATNPASPDVVSTYAGGRVLEVVRLGLGDPPEVLLESGENLVVLHNDGAGNLQ